MSISIEKSATDSQGLAQPSYLVARPAFCLFIITQSITVPFPCSGAYAALPSLIS